MTRIRYRKIDPPSETFSEEYEVMAGSGRGKVIGRVGRRLVDRRWDAIPPGAEMRVAIERSRADALGALMNHACIR